LSVLGALGVRVVGLCDPTAAAAERLLDDDERSIAL
jgi:hypothetical protein